MTEYQQSLAPNVLFHVWCENNEDFFQRLDKVCEGWPAKATQVIRRHDEGRTCYFSTASYEIRNEWNTTIAFADEYYLWKLSSAAKEKLKSQLRAELKQELLGFIHSK